MVELTDLLHLSSDNEEGFLEFERLARAEMERAIAGLADNESWEDARLEFMSAVQAAFEEFEITGTGSLGDINRAFALDDFNWFNQAVKQVKTRLQVRAIRRGSGDLIVLEPNDKNALIAEVGRLKNRVTKAVDLTEDRKHALISRIDELLQEIEKPRFNVKAFALTVAAVAAALVGLETAVIKGPETVVKLLEIVDLAHGKEAQRVAIIEQYRKPRAIEHKPTAAAPLGDFSDDLDDEIPF